MRRRPRSDAINTTSLATDGVDSLRRAIAESAARLIAEGLTDYGAAKRKAAQQLGLVEVSALPDNVEIEAALREHHALFASQSQPRALAALRAAALGAMQWLELFSPWISGPVLSGSANEYSAIELELIGVDAKSFEMFLLNDDVVFELHGGDTTGVSPSRGPSGHRKQGRSQATNALVPVRYDVTFDDAPVEITLFDTQAARLAAFPKSSIRHQRAQFADATARFLQD